jgi:hypothetical protein
MILPKTMRPGISRRPSSGEPSDLPVRAKFSFSAAMPNDVVQKIDCPTG